MTPLLRTTRTSLYEKKVISSGPRTSVPQALKGRPEQATDDSTPKPSKAGRKVRPAASTHLPVKHLRVVLDVDVVVDFVGLEEFA